MAKGKRILKKQTDKIEAVKENEAVEKMPVDSEKLEEVKEEVIQEEPVKNAEEEDKAAAKEAAVKKKTPAKSTAAKKIVKKPAEKAAPKSSTSKFDIYIQYGGNEIEQQDVITRVKNIWVKEMGNRIKDIDSLRLYLKPEENAVYYVINEEVSGSISLY